MRKITISGAFIKLDALLRGKKLRPGDRVTLDGETVEIDG